MNVFELEETKQELFLNLSKEKSPIGRLEFLKEFCRELKATNNPLLFEAFLPEILPKYLIALKSISAFGIDPEIVNSEIKCITDFLSVSKTEVELSFIDEIDRIKNEITRINKSLSGFEEFNKTSKLSFPVNINGNNELNFGQIETFSIKIYHDKTLKNDKFIVIPSREHLEKRLENQLKNSWQIALNHLRKYYSSPHRFHEIVIIFNNKSANIEGFSLGIAITLGFIQELFTFYNTSLSFSFNSNVTFTGGIEIDGSIIKLNKGITEQKTTTVFFTDFNYFVVPEQDSSFAKEKLAELKILYPNRKLKIIGVEEFEDLLNHRQVMNIEKAKILERSFKFAKKNGLALFLSAILLAIILAFSIYTVDNNPYEFKIVNSTVHILNKHGKILWSTIQPFGKSLVINADEQYSHRIYDIDDDGTNEVLLVFEQDKNIEPEDNRRIACFNNNGILIWKYNFRDSISRNGLFYDVREFQTYLLDIIIENSKPVLLAVAKHNYFPSAIFKLDARTGERLAGTLWSQGHFRRGIVGDFDNDGIEEIFIGGINNGLESAFILLVDVNKLFGQTPGKTNYLFDDLPVGNFQQYFLLQKTDISNYLKRRFNGIEHTGIEKNTGDYIIQTLEGKIKLPIGLGYRFHDNFRQVKIQIGDDMQFIRDSLIIKGEINAPLTSDPEFTKEVIKRIKIWDGKNFTNYNLE